jgi:hypothetical protein
MLCANCKAECDDRASECRQCGIVFAKFARLQKKRSEPESQDPVTSTELRQELLCRLLALPSALIGARLLVGIMPMGIRLLSMWVHEGGHALTAWLCGFSATPGPWFTAVASERSRLLSLPIAGLIGFGTYRSWRGRRWGFVAAGVAAFLVQVICTGKLYSDQAQQLIIFGGDAGCFVLGSLLMASFYIRKESAVHQNHLRWGFLVIGALAFMDAFAVWFGGIGTIPFGENENGMSDPSVLTEMYGWSIKLLMERYQHLAVLCLMLLALRYIAGIAAVLAPAGDSSRLQAASNSTLVFPQNR